MAGRLLKGLLTLRLRTHNSLALGMMFVGGMTLVAPVMGILLESGGGGEPPLAVYTQGQIDWGATLLAEGGTLLCAVIPGILLLANFALNVIDWRKS